LALRLALPREGFGTNVTKRGFHRIRLRATRRVVRPGGTIAAARLTLPTGITATAAKITLARTAAWASRAGRTTAGAASASTTITTGILPLRRRLQVVRLWRVFALRVARLALHGRTPIAATRTLLPRTASGAALARSTIGLTRWPWIAARLRAAQRIRQGCNVVVIKLDECAALESTRQHDRAIANANQTADSVADRLKHAAHFAVAAFRNRHLVPTVGALAATGFKRAELSHAVVELNTLQQAFFLFVVQRTQHTDSVFTLQTKTRVHQLVGEFSRARQQQQALRVQV
jgi:hypothetical protein